MFIFQGENFRSYPALIGEPSVHKKILKLGYLVLEYCFGMGLLESFIDLRLINRISNRSSWKTSSRMLLKIFVEEDYLWKSFFTIAWLRGDLM